MMFEEKLSKARAAYAAKLHDKLDRLEELLRLARRADARELVEQAQRLAHGICGGAGTFGIDAVASATGVIDQRLLDLLAGSVASEATFWQEIDAELARARAATQA